MEKLNLPKMILLIIVSLLLCSCAADKPTNPNILFIAVDDLRPELNCYGAGDIKSPNIDKLADEGTLFERAYCNIPVCGASRASLLTGLRPTRNTFLHYYTRADKDAPNIKTLPELLRDNGYYTISNGKVFHDLDDNALAWDENWRISGKSSWRDYLLPENIQIDEIDNQRGPAFEKADVHDTLYIDGKTAEKSIRDLRRLSGIKEPFFLAVGFVKPHLPFNAPKKYWDLYDPNLIVPPPAGFKPSNAPKEAFHNSGELRSYGGVPIEGAVNDEFAAKLIHGYKACVSYTDQLIGNLLDELKALELDQNTIVIIWGDHGWNLREHGMWCKHCLFETSLHTPLIVKVPWEKSSRVKSIVEYVDIYPSLCELVGINKPDHLEGRSFVDMIKDQVT